MCDAPDLCGPIPFDDEGPRGSAPHIGAEERGYSNCYICTTATAKALIHATTADDHTTVIDFLAAPSTHGGGTVERIDTHSSIVFLAGTRAHTLTRAVQLDYLDLQRCCG